MSEQFVSSAVIVDDGNVLLIKRARDPYSGRWALISGVGGSKKGLSGYEAVRDEVMHDIGAEFIGEFCFDYPLAEADYANRVYVFLGRVVTKEHIVLNPKAVLDAKWFSDQELEICKADLAFNDGWVLDRVKEFTRQVNLSKEGVQ